MTAVTSALRARRTVRITYYRSTDLHVITVNQGEDSLEWLVSILPSANWEPDAVEAYVEREAASAARCRGLDISRLDVA